MTPTPAIHLSSAIPAGEALRLARRAEDMGIERVWLSEDLFYRGAVPTAGAIAAVTTTISLGFGVLTPFNRHPSLMAMEMATLLELAGDRVAFGLGAGVKARVDRTGVAYRRPLAAMKESVEIIRGMLAGETVTLEGEVHSADRLSLDVDASWAKPPIFLASSGPKSLRQTGEIADGLVLTVMSSVAHARWATGVANQAAAAAGRPHPLPTVVYLPLAVDDDPSGARRRLKPTVGFYVRRWAGIPTLAALFTDWGPLSQAELDDLAARLEAGENPEDVIPDSLVDEYCIAGTIDECVAALARYGDAGVTEAAFDPGRGEVDMEALTDAVADLNNATRDF